MTPTPTTTTTPALRSVAGGKDTAHDLLRDVRQRARALDATCNATAARLAASAAASRADAQAIQARIVRNARADRLTLWARRLRQLAREVEREEMLNVDSLNGKAEQWDAIATRLNDRR